MARITITSQLSKAERQRLRRWANRVVERDVVDGLYGLDHGKLVVADEPALDGGEAAPLDAHRIARKAMVGIGRTFEYEIS